ncbi:hypothetical protein BC629DRAFT_1591539 [Irpex lacteus]|nr:hypothetical protein BC629DRAFT_1591539 [Irpex lacteus]
MEDSHRRSINIDMGLVGANAFRASDCDRGMGRAIENWNPEFQAQPTQPDGGAQKHQRDAKVSQPPCLVHGLKIRSRQTPLLDCSAMARDKLQSEQDFGNFLYRENKTITKHQKHVLDPFLDTAAPFGHSRTSSVESIPFIDDEKQNSLLNKAIASFTDSDGGVAHDSVQKLQVLNSHNSKHKFSIEKFLTKSEEALFDKVKKDKQSSAASI